MSISSFNRRFVGDLLFQWFMKMSTSCRNRSEYNRYHATLTMFLSLPTTRAALSKKCIDAVKSMKRDLRAREHKLAGYVRHGLKSHMLAMTTSPVEGQNKHLRHGEDRVGVKYQTNRSLLRIITRAQRNFRARKARAYDELARNCVFSNAWTGTYLIRKGQALVDRFHSQRRVLKSARLSQTVYITWNFDIDDWLDHPDPLYVHLPIMLRVEELNVSSPATPGCFVKCTCGGREGIGVPCSCFFRIGDNAGLSPQEIIHPQMVDIRYWKLFHTHYETNTDLGRLLNRAQAEAFANENKGIPVAQTVIDKLREEILGATSYPLLGPNTTKTDLEEAMFVRSRTSTTYRDIQRYRKLPLKSDYADGEWTKVVGEDDFATAKMLSPTGQRMQAAIEKGVKEVEVRRKEQENFVRPDEAEKDDFYRTWTQTIREFVNDSRTSVAQLKSANAEMVQLFERFHRDKLASFPDHKTKKRNVSDTQLEMLGNCGDHTPQKKRKRGKC